MEEQAKQNELKQEIQEEQPPTDEPPKTVEQSQEIDVKGNLEEDKECEIHEEISDIDDELSGSDVELKFSSDDEDEEDEDEETNSVEEEKPAPIRKLGFKIDPKEKKGPEEVKGSGLQRRPPMLGTYHPFWIQRSIIVNAVGLCRSNEARPPDDELERLL